MFFILFHFILSTYTKKEWALYMCVLYYLYYILYTSYIYYIFINYIHKVFTSITIMVSVQSALGAPKGLFFMCPRTMSCHQVIRMIAKEMHCIKIIDILHLSCFVGIEHLVCLEAIISGFPTGRENVGMTFQNLVVAERGP